MEARTCEYMCSLANAGRDRPTPGMSVPRLRGRTGCNCRVAAEGQARQRWDDGRARNGRKGGGSIRVTDRVFLITGDVLVNKVDYAGLAGSGR